MGGPIDLTLFGPIVTAISLIPWFVAAVAIGFVPPPMSRVGVRMFASGIGDRPDLLINANGDTAHRGYVGGAGAPSSRYQFGGGRDYSYSELVGEFSNDTVAADDDDGDRHVLGGRRNDTLGASVAFATLSGGRGDDTISASGGNNTYLFSLGDGADTIVDTSAKIDGQGNPIPNTIVFGAGITLADLRLSGASGFLRVQVGADPGDGITLGGYDQGNPAAPTPIDLFEFADGSVLTFAELIARGFDGGDGAGTFNDFILGSGVGTLMLPRPTSEAPITADDRSGITATRRTNRRAANEPHFAARRVA